MNPRFKVYFIEDARKEGFECTDSWHDFCYHIYDFGDGYPKFVGCDSMEPEDASFVRDLSWVVELLNKLGET